MKLQRFNFEESTYERPNRKWTCGRSSDGCPCKQGPIEKPFLNLFSASCSQKENRCKPNRTIRGLRAILNFIVILFFTAIVVYIFCFQENNKSFINPGALASFHSTIEGQDCSTCHDLQGHKSWLGAAISKHSSLDDSKKCLACHQFNSKLDEREHIDLAALRPHAVNNAAIFGNDAHKFENELSCMTCHHEHRGYKNDMKTMSNIHCQDCHEKKFESLSHGHPDFNLYPYKKDNYVNFSHRTHQKYFKENNKEDLLGNENCNKCHTVNHDQGKTIKSTTREHVCLQCHNHTIPIEPLAVRMLSLANPFSGESPQNVTVKDDLINSKTLPGLTKAKLVHYFNDKSNLHDIIEGLTSREVSDLTLTPEESIKSLVNDLVGNWNDLLYLKKAIQSGKTFTDAMLWTIVDRIKNHHKNLYNDFMKNHKEQAASIFYEDILIRKPLQMIMSEADLSIKDRESFIKNLDHEKVLSILNSIASSLPADIKKHVPSNLSMDDSDSFIIKYLKQSKKLTPKILNRTNTLLKPSPSSIYKVVKEFNLPTGSSVYYKKFYSQLEKAVDDKPELINQLKKEFNNPLPLFTSTVLKNKKVFKDFSKLLDKDLQKKITLQKLTGNDFEALKPYTILIQLNLAYLLDSHFSDESSPPDSLPKVSRPGPFVSVENKSWKKSADNHGHQYLDHLTIPTHASPIMVKAYSNGVFKETSDPSKSAGSCLHCHFKINYGKIARWKTPVSKKGLTKFKHAPHGKNCNSCHIFKKDDDETLLGYDNYHKEFRPMQKEDCMSCHKPEGAVDTCLQCHNYHATDYDEQKAEFLNLIQSFQSKSP